MAELIRENWETGSPNPLWSNVNAIVQTTNVYAGNYAAAASDTQSARINVNTATVFAEAEFALSKLPSYVVALLQFFKLGDNTQQIGVFVNMGGTIQLWTNIGGETSRFYGLNIKPNIFHKIGLGVDSLGAHVYVNGAEVITMPELVAPTIGEVAFGQRWQSSGVTVYMDEHYVGTELPTQQNWTLIVQAGAGGTVSHSTITGAIGQASPVITATPDASFQFDHWLFDGIQYLDNPISLIINDAESHQLLAVFVSSTPQTYQTPFTLELDPGTYLLTATFEGRTLQQQAVISSDATTEISFDFTTNIIYNVSGTVLDKNGNPLAGVTVKAEGTSYAASTDENGAYLLSLPQGAYVLLYQKPGFLTVKAEVNVTADLILGTVTLPPTPNALIWVAIGSIGIVTLVAGG